MVECNPSNQEAVEDLKLKDQAWTTYQVQVHPGLHRETLSQSKQTKKKK
jgi:hypothetical protein